MAITPPQKFRTLSSTCIKNTDLIKLYPRRWGQAYLIYFNICFLLVSIQQDLILSHRPREIYLLEQDQIANSLPKTQYPAFTYSLPTKGICAGVIL